MKICKCGVKEVVGRTAKDDLKKGYDSSRVEKKHSSVFV